VEIHAGLSLPLDRGDELLEPRLVDPLEGGRGHHRPLLAPQILLSWTTSIESPTGTAPCSNRRAATQDAVGEGLDQRLVAPRFTKALLYPEHVPGMLPEAGHGPAHHHDLLAGSVGLPNLLRQAREFASGPLGSASGQLRSGPLRFGLGQRSGDHVVEIPARGHCGNVDGPTRPRRNWWPDRS